MLPSYAANSSLHEQDELYHSRLTTLAVWRNADPHLADVAAALLLAALTLDSS